MKDFRAQEAAAFHGIVKDKETYKKLANARKDIMAVMRQHKAQYSPDNVRDAVRYLNYKQTIGSNPALYIAAAYIVNKEKELLQEHIENNLRDMHIKEQLIELEKRAFPEAHKITLRQYYSNRLTYLQQRIDKVLNEMLKLRIPLCKQQAVSADYIPPRGRNGYGRGTVIS